MASEIVEQGAKEGTQASWICTLPSLQILVAYILIVV